MAKVTLTVTLPNGEIIKRTTHRTYTHAVVVEYRYTNGVIKFDKATWAGRLGLAQNAAARERARVAKHIGKSCTRYRLDANGKGEIYDLDYGYEDIRVHMIPVNA